MSVRKFVTQFGNYTPKKGTINNMESMTKPDQSLSARQLFINHTRGHALGAAYREGIYSETEIPTLDDITDIVAHKEELEDRQRELQKEIDEIVKKQKEAAEAAKKTSEPSKPDPEEKVSEKS